MRVEESQEPTDALKIGISFEEDILRGKETTLLRGGTLVV
jgi:hypothetical protein